MKLHTIGFTRKSAERFFGLLTAAGVRRVIDIRLFNRSQLAGFSKADDLQFFLKSLAGIEYVHEPLLAPSEELFRLIKREGGAWEDYAAGYRRLLEERRVDQRLDRTQFHDACLLCSEDSPERCHRRLLAEFLQERWSGMTVHHLR